MLFATEAPGELAGAAGDAVGTGQHMLNLVFFGHLATRELAEEIVVGTVHCSMVESELGQFGDGVSSLGTGGKDRNCGESERRERREQETFLHAATVVTAGKAARSFR